VSFGSQALANKVIGETHCLKGRFLNVSYPNEKRIGGMNDQQNSGFGNMPGYGNMQGGMQNNVAGGMNTQPWMQGKMQNPNAYGYQQNNGKYGMLGLGGNNMWTPKS